MSDKRVSLYTFSIYNRADRPFVYWLGVAAVPTVLLFFLCLSFLATVAALWPL